MKRAITPAMVLLVFVFQGFFVPEARAALDCAQLVAIAQSTLGLRDQGMSLSAVLAEVETAEMRANLNAQEINLLRQIVRISFTSEYSPREVHEACVAGSLGIPKPKP
jgi:hypothetical protein